ncbi:GNAT family N-acetyltransferase [Rhizobium glycinendophyticum]|uniref:GNAT family N-acetyltransferase n=1 Tax=Rhizobium glycinendophyticum TaxID=2589807 RepID=A0A504UV54_9HYPH|nr:GNAT family N-acetyltransferase [Rhizobium glycinendophyticum]TPP10631.1 GNAT family N-acetyltransferase [Rhizobium glycinendophyticum]
MPALGLRRATEADIPFIMETERLPGYELTVGRFEEDEHSNHLADPAWLYLVHPEMGLALLHGVGGREGNLCLRRFIVTKTSNGFGSALLPLVLSHVFNETSTHRLWLHHVKDNTKAARLYARFGFLHEGVEREAGLRPDGSRFDLVNLSILRPEWASRCG